MPSLALPKPSTTTSSYPPSGMASEAGLSPETLHLMRCLCSLWPQIKTVGGVRRGVPLYGDDHARGIAIDVMIEGHDSAAGRADGDAIADYTRTHARRLDVRYIIWRQKIWNIEHASDGWRPMADRGSMTQNHFDHVHVSTYPKV